MELKPGNFVVWRRSKENEKIYGSENTHYFAKVLEYYTFTDFKVKFFSLINTENSIQQRSDLENIVFILDYQ